MRTFLLAFASLALIAAAYADDWPGCPEGTKFDSYIKSRADIGSNRPCDNGRVRSNAQYVEGRLPYPVCCAPIGRARRAAFGKEADALPENAPKTNGAWQKA